MRKTNTKTSLNITLNPDGSALTNMRWSDLDVEHKPEASERVLAALSNVPDYQWLFKLLHPYLHEKYCAKCQKYDESKPCDDNKSEPPYPYCFVGKK